MSEKKRRKGIFHGQPQSEMVRWTHGAPLKTSDPENDDTRAFLLASRLRTAGYEDLAQAFDELWETDIGKTATQAALLIAGHMSGPSLRFAGRPARSVASVDFEELKLEAGKRIAAGESRCAVVLKLVDPIYSNGRAPGHGLPATAKALRDKLNRALKQRGESAVNSV